LAPRKPERFDTAAELLRRKGAAFLRRSELRSGTPLALPGVLLGLAGAWAGNRLF